jgi:hypothetical protein
MRGEMAPIPPTPDERLAAWLDGPGRATGQRLPVGDPRATFEVWLALTDNGYVRVQAPGAEPPAFGLRDELGAALLRGEGPEPEVRLFGAGDEARRRLTEAYDAWEQRRPPVTELRVTAHRAGEEPPIPDGVRVLRRERFTFLVTRP